MTTAERMLKRLRVLLEPEGIRLPEGTELRRTNASGSQRNNGAWSWFTWHRDLSRVSGVGDIGSHYPMGIVLKCDAVTLQRTTFALHLDPCDECITRYGRSRF